MNCLSERLKKSVLIFDGAIGSEIYRRNFFVNASYEELNLSKPEVISEIHRKYADAGADVLTTNTYNGNARSLARFGLADRMEEINRAGVTLARQIAGNELLIAGSVGPLPAAQDGETETAGTGILARQIGALAEADFILFETLSSPEELAVVLQSIGAFPGRAYVPSFAVSDEEPERITRKLETFLTLLKKAPHPPEAIGLNCGSGPENMLKVIEILHTLTALPIIAQPNAGTPREIDGRHLYMASAEYFTTYARRYTMVGASALGGCCGIGPEHIAELARSLKPLLRGERRVLPEVVVKAGDRKPEIPLAERSNLGKKLASGEWIRLVEITPPRGFDLSKTIAGAKRCREAGIDAVNLPDGPRASSRISALVTAIAIRQQADIEPILHCCCRDRSLLGLQSELLGCAAAGINNVLFITGDPPKLGDYPFSSGVFDVDSIGLVKIQKMLNSGIDLGGVPINAATRTVIGVGADPNAVDFEREYRRTCEKAEAGADYVTTQPVFAVESLFRFLDRIEHLKLPVIAGIWPLTSLKNAEFMKTEVPGVVVPEEVMRRMAGCPDRDSQRAEGIAIARESIEAIKGRVQGIQVSAPFGNVESALKTIF